ncbi:MAG: histidinol-phosphate aminotransferase [Bacteroidota bacterium]|nr:MAG: histidinol-phosphate aminotransferase [Bacteroidota bacterium]
MFDLNNIIRENIKKMEPYSTARDEYKGSEGVFLDANESPFNTGLNRYPDPHHTELKKIFSQLKKVQPENILSGNGSDEIIDLIYRVFCEPGLHNVIILPPTYGMYKVAAQINNVEVKEVCLNEIFQPDAEKIFSEINENTRIVFFCSPNNPTGNIINKEAIKTVLKKFKGIVVVDEAYIDFCEEHSWLKELTNYPNLIIMQTFSKAWGMAGIRLGAMFASSSVVEVLHKIKHPYNINILTQRVALQALQNKNQKGAWVKAIVSQKEIMQKVLETLPFTEKVYPSDANFLLVKFLDSEKIFTHLLEQKIIVRNRSNVQLCSGCLRISVGTMDENLKLLEVLKNF